MEITVAHLLNRAHEILRECRELVREDEQDSLSTVHFEISKRLTSCAGKARYRTGKVTLSFPFFSDPENFEEHFRNTVTHEIAHIIAPSYHEWGVRRKPHGPEWASAHRRLGGTGKRCHSMKLAEAYQSRKENRVTRRVSARVGVACPKCGERMALGPTQYKRWQRGERYSHKRCPNNNLRAL